MHLEKPPCPDGEEASWAMLIHQDFSLWYPRYLQSEHWRQLRERVKRRANNWCERCHTHVAEEIHHRTYANVGNENLGDLQAVCRPCHRKIHNNREPRYNRLD